MIGATIQSQQDEDQVYDIVIVVEKTANLVPYLDELKTAYLLPTLEYFNGGPPSSIDTGHDYNCTLYCLVTYTAGDSAPEMASDCTFPTTSTFELIQAFDNLEFIGGAGQSCSHLSEGFSTALQCLDEIKQLRHSSKPTQRHCILICNSPPYHIIAEESQDYRGYNSEQLASMMGKRGVNLSIISPRKIPALQKLFNEACSGDSFYSHPQAHYAVDPRHLVLLKGYQLQERSISPKGDKEKDLMNMNVSSPALVTDQVVGKVDTFKKPLLNQTAGLQQASPQQGMQPSPTPVVQSSMNMQQSNLPSSMVNPNNLPTVMDPMGVGPGMQGTQGPPGAAGKPGMMTHTRPQTSKLQSQSSLSGAVGMLQQQIPPRQQVQQDQSFLMRQQSMGVSGQGMMGMQQQNNMGISAPNLGIPTSGSGGMSAAGSVGMSNVGNVAMSSTGGVGSISSSGPIMNHHMQANMMGTLAQSNMMGAQAQSNMISSMQTGGPQSQGMMQPGGVLGGLQPTQQQQPQQQQQPSQQSPYTHQNSFGNDQQGQSQMVNLQGQISVVSGPRERRVIWSGTIEYQDRNGQSATQRNVTFILNCNVSVDVQDTDISTADWPPKLTIQLLPQAMLTGLQQQCKNSRQVFFHFPNSNNNPNPEALRNLYTLMGHGFAGCVSFPSTSEIRIILLMYSAKKKSFIGLIPNDQMGIVHGIKTVVTRHRQKVQGFNSGVLSSQGTAGMPNQVMAGGSANAPQGNMGAAGIMQPQMSMPVSASQQQGLQQASQQQGQQKVHAAEQLRQAGLQGMHTDIQAVKQFQQQQQQQHQQQHQQQQPQVVEQKVIMVQQQQQQQQQVQQQQMLANRAKLQHQQMQAQRLQMQQQQQQQQQQQVANPQLRHLLINAQQQQQQQQLRQQQQQQQMMMQQQMRGGNPQGQPGMVMGPGGQQGMQAGGMGQMAPQPGQGFMDDFSLPEIL